MCFRFVSPLFGLFGICTNPYVLLELYIINNYYEEQQMCSDQQETIIIINSTVCQIYFYGIASIIFVTMYALLLRLIHRLLYLKSDYL